MNALVLKAVELYKKQLAEDIENTDSLFFIIEDIGHANDMDETEYTEFETLVFAATDELGI